MKKKAFKILFSTSLLFNNGCQPPSSFLKDHPQEEYPINDVDESELCPVFMKPECKHSFNFVKIKSKEINEKSGPTPRVTFDFDKELIEVFEYPSHYSGRLTKVGRNIVFEPIQVTEGIKNTSYNISSSVQKVLNETRSYKLRGRTLMLLNASGAEIAELESQSQNQWESKWNSYCDALHVATAQIIEEFKSGLEIEEAVNRMNSEYLVNHEFTLRILLKVSSTTVEQWDAIPSQILDKCYLYPIPKNLDAIPILDENTRLLTAGFVT